MLYTHEAPFFNNGKYDDVIDSTSRRDLDSEALPTRGLQLLTLIWSRCNRWRQDGAVIGSLSMGMFWLGPAW
jgi:hypothetical protein